MVPTSVVDTEFIGRTCELGLIQDSLASPTDVALCFCGIAGIGKTWFLQNAASYFRKKGIAIAVCNLKHYRSLDYLRLLSLLRNQLNGSYFVLYDKTAAQLQERLTRGYQELAGEIPPISINIQNSKFKGNVGDIVGMKLSISVPHWELEQFHVEMQNEITQSFVDCVRSMSDHTPTLFLLDNYETIDNPALGNRTPLAEWIENHFLPRFMPDARQLLFVIARRQPLAWGDHDREWRDCMKSNELGYFDISEIET